MLPFIFLCKFAPMKRLVSTCILLGMISLCGLDAQNKKKIGHNDHNIQKLNTVDSLSVDSLRMLGMTKDSLKIKKPKDPFDGKLPNIYGWKISPRLGERTLVDRDTTLINFHQSMLVDGKDVAVSYLGNIGSPTQSKIFFNRPESSRFIFLDGFQYWRKNPEDQLFLNTKIPYSNVYYQSAGSGEKAENRFQAEMSYNIGKKLNVGFDFDYIYARGFYTSLFNKQVNYDLYTSYIGDKYKMHAFFSNNNFNNSENGGLVDEAYVKGPGASNLQNAAYNNTLNYPVRMTETWNKMRGRNFYVTNRYDLGRDTEMVIVNDTTAVKRKKKDYISPASVIFTTHYTDQRRRINSTSVAQDSIYNSPLMEGNNIIKVPYQSEMNDYMAYWSFKNTLALAMNEGFRSWTKFGLTAFVEYDMRKYAYVDSQESINLQGMRGVESENSLIIGGVLSKAKGENLLFNISAEKNLLGSDYKLQADITGKVNFLNKSLSAKATAYVKGIEPTFFENRFGSKYWSWKNDFSDVRRVYIGGEINLPSFSFSRTKISGGVENLTNYIYYGSSFFPEQETSNIQVVALRLDQELQAGILHWDNRVVYQKTTNEIALPLPDLSVYSNLYISSKIAKVLKFQLGVDAHFHTKYYAPTYEPLTMQFYNQRVREVGNFPISTAYLNLHLKYTRFFIMMYNLLDGIGNADSFTMYRYPVDPRGLRLGLSWQFNN